MPVEVSGENVIPEAVRRSTARAEQIAREVGMANTPDAPLEPPASDDVSGQGNTPPAVETPPVVPPVATPPAGDWEQKYRTLQGKYDSEIPGLRSQVNGLQQVLANLETRPPQQPAKPDPAPAATTVVAPPTSEDLEAYGPELIDAVRRWVRSEVQPLMDELRTKVDGLGSNFQKVETSQRQTAVTNAREFVKAALNNDQRLGALVAGSDGKETRFWIKTNLEPGFIAWVQQVDPFSGQIRQPLLQGAFDSGQSDRVLAFFNAYLSEHTASQVPASDPAHTPPPQEQQGAGRPTLEDFAAPGRGSAAPPAVGATSEKRTWSQPEIAAFYRDVNRGVYAGRDADKLRTEQDIFAATTEGRIK